MYYIAKIKLSIYVFEEYQLMTKPIKRILVQELGKELFISRRLCQSHQLGVVSIYFSG